MPILLTNLPSLAIGATDLAAAFLFMYGLKRMSSPVTASSGILVAGIGMLVAVVASFLYVFDVAADARPHLLVNCGLAVVALLIGGGAAWWAGKRVAMTAMPEMVAIYNGMGGGAAGAIAAVELFGNRTHDATTLDRDVTGRADRCRLDVGFGDRLGEAGRRAQSANAVCWPAGIQSGRLRGHCSWSAYILPRRWPAVSTR